MNKFIYILLFLLIQNTFSQINSGIVEYKKIRLKKVFKKNEKIKSANFETFSKIENSINEIQKEIGYVKKIIYRNKVKINENEIQKEIIFNLLYKDGKSFFEVRKKMSISKNRFFKMSLGPEGISKYYNSEKEIIRQVNAFGEDFLISKPKYNWDLKKETKKIGKYTCYKATMVEKIKTRKGVKNVLIQAWYTSEVNIPYGPIGYSGLPGLIIELKRNNINYYATKINLTPGEDLLIKKPTKGKKVTQEEFYDIAINAMKDFRKNRGY